MQYEKRFEIAGGGGELLVFQVGENWQVWLNVKQDFDGVLLATGHDHTAALANAVEFLIDAVRRLKLMQPDAGANGSRNSQAGNDAVN